jgi:DNA-directed RNA polymerase subunit RPC12/RpoP
MKVIIYKCEKCGAITDGRSFGTEVATEFHTPGGPVSAPQIRRGVRMRIGIIEEELDLCARCIKEIYMKAHSLFLLKTNEKIKEEANER